MKNINLWTALITPMKEDGSIHFSDLEKLVHRQENAGNGILLIGSTGEGLALSDPEKHEVVDCVAGMKPNVPLMVGVGGFNLESQKKWVETCNSMNVDAFLLVTPLYAKPGPRGQVHWFKSLMDSAEKPCMLYNIPSRAGTRMPISVLKEVEGHPRLWAVKEASGSIDDYLAFRNAAPEIPLYSGDDGLMPFFSAAGSGGLVSVAANVWPEATSLFVEKCLASETQNLFPVWSDAVDALFSASNPIPAKLLLKEKGVIEHATLRPPLLPDELSDLTELKKTDQEIENWYQSNK